MGLPVFRCKDMTDSLGSHFTPAALLAHDGGVQSLRTHCKERRASSAPRRLRRLDEFAYANHAIPPWPRSASSMLADTPLPHGFSANLTVAGFVVRASITSRYLPAMAPRVLAMGGEVRSNSLRRTILTTASQVTLEHPA